MPASSTSRTSVTPDSVYAESWRVRLGNSTLMTPTLAFDVSPGDVLVVAVAHPDDETLAMGSSLARLAHDGVRVHVVAMSRGEAAVAHTGVAVDGLAERRHRELVAAASALGVSGTTVLDLPDSRLADHAAAIATAVAEAIERLGARRVATLWRHDPHPDHQAVSRGASVAARSAGALVHELGLWSTHWTDPADVATEVVRLDNDEPSDRARREALACYTSQTEPLAPGLEPVLPPSVLDWPHEYLVRS